MSELFYKYMLTIMIAISGIIRGLYEFRYHRVEKKIIYYEYRERSFVLFVGGSYMIPALLYLFTPWIDFASFNLATTYRVLGIILMLINILFFLRIHIVLGENWSPILEIGKEQTLVTSGPYKYVRHPMYTCFFVHAITLWLITANHLVGAVAFSSFAIIYPIRVVAEEKMMIEQFGKSYEDYIKKTGRLWPKLF